jgi:hypothetical protein
VLAPRPLGRHLPGVEALDADLDPQLRSLLGQRVAVAERQPDGDRPPLGGTSGPAGKLTRPGPGGRQAVQGKGAARNRSTSSRWSRTIARAGLTTPSTSVASDRPEPPPPQNAVERKNSHTAATKAAATSHQGQPNPSWTATPSAAPTSIANRYVTGAGTMVRRRRRMPNRWTGTIGTDRQPRRSPTSVPKLPLLLVVPHRRHTRLVGRHGPPDPSHSRRPSAHAGRVTTTSRAPQAGHET